MEKIQKDWSTEVLLTKEEAITVCRVGSGEGTCAFVGCSKEGWCCLRMLFPTNLPIIERLKKGTMNAKGVGGWSGCAWEGEGYVG